MDNPLRAPWRAMIRYTVCAVGIAAALVLLSLLLGARPASAASGDPTASSTTQRGLVSGLVDGAGKVVGTAVAPVRSVVSPAAPAPAPVAPRPAAPAAPQPAPAPAPAPAPRPAVPAAAPVAPAPVVPAPARPAPATSAPVPALVSGVTTTVRTVTTPVTQAATTVVHRASDPVTSTVRTVTDARPVTAVVDTVDGVIGSLPVVGSVVGDDALGAVTQPVTGAVDGVLGDVGTIVGSVPGIVDAVPPVVDGVLPGGADPLVPLPVGPVVTGPGTPALPVGSVPTVPGGLPGTPAARSASAPVLPAAAPALGADGAAGHGDAGSRSSVTVLAPSAGVTAGVAEPGADQRVGSGSGLLVAGSNGSGPEDGPFDGSGPGVVGGSASNSSGAAPVLGLAGSGADQFSLAAGSRGTLADDAVPASVTGEHDVAPD